MHTIKNITKDRRKIFETMKLANKPFTYFIDEMTKFVLRKCFVFSFQFITLLSLISY